MLFLRRSHNAQGIGSVPGLIFSTSTGGSIRFADINSTWYPVTSDNGKVFHDGSYFVSGDVAAYLPNLSDRGRIDFANGLASWFTVGYSSEDVFVIEAYDSSNVLLTSTTGAANTKAKGGTGLAYLTVSHPGISYVVLHDNGNYWMIDNITTDAPVPEPASCVALFIGLAGLAMRVKAPRRR